MKFKIINRGTGKEWEVDSPATAAKALMELLIDNEDYWFPNGYEELIKKIISLDPCCPWSSWVEKTQALILVTNLRTRADLYLVKENGEMINLTPRGIDYRYCS